MPVHPLAHGIVQPWQIAAVTDSLTAVHGRPALLTPADVQRVVLEIGEEPLPLLCGFADERRFEWKCFELPATSDSTSGAPMQEDVNLNVFVADREPRTVRVSLTRGLAWPQTGDTTTPARWHAAATAAKRLVVDHVEQMAALSEAWRDDPRACRNDARSTTVWPVSAVLEAWLNTETGKDLFEILAPRLLRTLLLIEKRSLQSQPTTAPMTQASASAAVSTAHHPAVLREVLTRLDRECGVHPHTDQTGESKDDVLSVASLRRVARRMARAIDAARAFPTYDLNLSASVQGPAAPQLRLRRLMSRLDQHQREVHRAWRWRQRIWSEACHLLMLAALDHIQPGAAGTRSRFNIRTHAQAGRFITADSATGRWDIPLSEGGAVVYVVEGRQIEAYTAISPLPHELVAMRPDLLVLRHDLFKPDQPPSAILALWTLLDFDLDGDHLAERCEQVNQKLKQIRTPGALTAWIMQPAPNGDAPQGAATSDEAADTPGVKPLGNAKTDRCLGVRLAIPLQHHVAAVATLIREQLL